MTSGDGVFTAPSNDELIDEWLRLRSEWTKRTYRADVEPFVRWLGKPLYRATRADIDAYLVELAGEDLSPSRRANRATRVEQLVASARATTAVRGSSLHCPCGYGQLERYRIPADGTLVFTCDECEATFE